MSFENLAKNHDESKEFINILCHDCLCCVFDFLCTTDLFSAKRICSSFLHPIHTSLSQRSELCPRDLPCWKTAHLLEKYSTGLNVEDLSPFPDYSSFHLFTNIRGLVWFLGELASLESVTLRVKEIKHGDHFTLELLRDVAPSNLKHLTLEYTGDEQRSFCIYDLQHISPNLRTLKLLGVHVCDLESLRAIPNLQTLEFKFCTFNCHRTFAETMKGIAQLSPNITGFSLDNRIDITTVAQFAKNIPNLKTLEIRIPYGEMAPISLFSDLKQLQKLDINGLYLDVFTPFPCLVGCQLSNSMDNMPNWEDMPAGMFPNVTELGLGHGVDDNDLLGISKGMPNLGVLWLVLANVTPCGVKVLSRLPLKEFRNFCAVNSSTSNEICGLLNDKTLFPLMDDVCVEEYLRFSI